MKRNLFVSIFFSLLALPIFIACPMEFGWLGRDEYKTVDISDRVSVSLVSDADSYCVDEPVAIAVSYTLDPKEYSYGFDSFDGEETECIAFGVKKRIDNNYENYYEFTCLRDDAGDAVVSVEKNTWKLYAHIEKWDNALKTGRLQLSFPEAGEYLLSYDFSVRSSEESSRYGGGSCKGEIKIKISDGDFYPDFPIVIDFEDSRRTVQAQDDAKICFCIPENKTTFESASFMAAVYKKDGEYFEDCEEYYFSTEKNPVGKKEFHIMYMDDITLDAHPFETGFVFSPVCSGEYLVDVQAMASNDEDCSISRGFTFTVK